MASQPQKAKKRAAPAFKPPRPAKAPASRSAATPRQRGAKSTTSHQLPLSSSSSDNEAETSADKAPTPPRESPPSPTQDVPPTIPPKLLTTLLHHHFQDPKTRISKDSNALLEKYVETFVREALARAAFERGEVGRKEGGTRGGEFLEVEDLEKLAPQLILDF